MKAIRNQDGFTYILALTVVMIMGVMLGMVGQSWKVVKQRELEDEMIFRGDQVAELIYQSLLCKNPVPAQNMVNQFLWPVDSPNGTVLDDLVNGKEESCSNGTMKKFRLRLSASLDPATNSQWQIVTPVDDTTRFSGVATDSTKEPLRKNFKSIYDSKQLDEKKQYSEWQFTWELKQSLPQNQNLPR